ncbi:MAG TPA: AAA family ATPase [Candidatus Binataceae bacterium]|nr:AAA family ATPase [Candidatus Binataceae bacterium]
MRDLIAATSLMRAFEKGLKDFYAIPPEPYACSVAIFVSGQSGIGTTTAAAQFAITTDAALFTPPPNATDRTWLDRLYESVVGGEPAQWGPDSRWREIERELKRRDGRALIADEIENMNHGQLESMRHICDRARAKLILCSRGSLLRALKAAATAEMQVLSSRAHVRVELPAPSLRDVKLLAQELSEVEIAGDLASDIFKRAGASIRAILHELQAIEQAALFADVKSLDLAGWIKMLGGVKAEAKLPAPLKAITARELPVRLNKGVA